MDQFVTLDTAKAIAAAINQTGIGGGIPPYTTDADPKSGIFIPAWAGPFPTPAEGDLKPYYFRFANGCSSVNAGLVQITMKYFPMSWPAMLALEAVPQAPMPWDL